MKNIKSIYDSNYNLDTSSKDNSLDRSFQKNENAGILVPICVAYADII